jgi:DNA-binding transcriptional LysR family regulator
MDKSFEDREQCGTMDLHRLRMLLELSRRGSMRAVADELGYTTSTISQQLGVLAREAGAQLLEADGRGVRLTPAGRRLADHAAGILAAVETARADLQPDAEPAGTVRVAGFASAIRRSLVPIIGELAPAVTLRVHEHEPPEAVRRLEDDEVDLALVYDYNLAPATFDATFEVTALWATRWALAAPRQAAVDEPAAAVFRRFRDAQWIVNSRNTADDEVIRTIAALADIRPDVAHRADSLDLVLDLIRAGQGVGLLPADHAVPPDVSLLALDQPEVLLRAYAITRPGRRAWPPVALLLRRLQEEGAGRRTPALV